jgi:hypothetical protein
MGLPLRLLPLYVIRCFRTDDLLEVWKLPTGILTQYNQKGGNMSASQKGLIDIFDIAKVCHEANMALCVGLGDMSQKVFEDSPQWQRDSAVNSVRFNLDNPGAPASASHDSWLEEKRLAGWKYGPVKDPEKKEHPCFVPYEALPAEQQAKDHLFKAIVGALAPLLSE